MRAAFLGAQEIKLATLHKSLSTQSQRWVNESQLHFHSCLFSPPLPSPPPSPYIVHFLHLLFRIRSQLQPGSCRRWFCTCPEIIRLCTQHTRWMRRGRLGGSGSQEEVRGSREGMRGAQQDTRNLCSLHIIQMMPHYISHSMVSSLQLNAPQCSPSIWHPKSVL